MRYSCKKNQSTSILWVLQIVVYICQKWHMVLEKIQTEKNLWMLCNPYFTWLEFFFRLYINIYRIQKRFKNIKCDLCIVRFYRYKDLVYFSLFFIFSQYVIFCLCVFPLHPLFLMITLDCVRKGWLIYD